MQARPTLAHEVLNRKAMEVERIELMVDLAVDADAISSGWRRGPSGMRTAPLSSCSARSSSKRPAALDDHRRVHPARHPSRGRPDNFVAGEVTSACEGGGWM